MKKTAHVCGRPTALSPEAGSNVDPRPVIDGEPLGYDTPPLVGNDDINYALALALEGQRVAQWLQQTLSIFAREPQWWEAVLPQWLWRRRTIHYLERRGLFSAVDYARRYPDIAKAGTDPLYHFVQHGLAEKREGRGRANGAVARDEYDQDIPAILASGMFDPVWYRAQYGGTGSDEDLVREHLLNTGLQKSREPGPLFSDAIYQLKNAPSHGIPPLVHYVREGRRQGHCAWTAGRADAFIASSRGEPLQSLRDLIDLERPIVVLHWSEGNFFFADIAHYLSEVLNAAGGNAIVKGDHAGLPLTDMELLVVAPHEYCVHGAGTRLPPEVAARAVYVNTEQWHTTWFSLALPYLMVSRRALDINPASARALTRLGIRAGFVPLLPRPGGIFEFSAPGAIDGVRELRAVKPLTYPEAFAQRPYDLMFVGALNQRRARALAQLAPTLAKHDCFLHAPRMDRPATLANRNTIETQALAQIARHSRVLLNIHQGSSRYFEWHRMILLGIAQGCVPLTEPCNDIGIVEAGIHYLAAPLDRMPAMLDWLLGTDAGARELDRLQANGKALITRLTELLADQFR